MSTGTFTYSITRTQQDTGAFARYRDLSLCGTAGNIYPPGWCLPDSGGDIDPIVDTEIDISSIDASCLKGCHCGADSDYLHKISMYDFIDFQWRIPGSWTRGFRTGASLAGTYDFDFQWWVYDTSLHATAGCFFDSAAFTIKNFIGTTKDGVPFQQSRWQITDATAAKLACANFNGRRTFFSLTVYPPAGGRYTIYSPPFQVDCSELCQTEKVKIRGIYCLQDFWGNIYTEPEMPIGTPFTFDNTMSYEGEFIKTATETKRNFDDLQNTKNLSVADVYHARLRPIPPYEVEYLKINLQAPRVFIDDKEFSDVTGFEKNNDLGLMWHPEFDAKENFGLGLNNPTGCNDC